MHISFDLDSTLIPHGDEFLSEPRFWVYQWLGLEKIRKGTPKLMTILRKNGCQIHIYSTSYRSKMKIRLTFALYGIRINKIVNQYDNKTIMNRLNKQVSKFPPAFGFDIHIDDSLGVKMEGEKNAFKVIHIDPQAEDWIKQILDKILISNLT